jgi:hypothetical protein
LRGGRISFDANLAVWECETDHSGTTGKPMRFSINSTPSIKPRSNSASVPVAAVPKFFYSNSMGVIGGRLDER